MFHHEGSERTDRQNRILAGYLALVAGFVNAAGFILVGTFTSHVTGNVGRLVDDGVLGQWTTASAAAVMVAAFFVGAFFASLLIESNVLRRRPYTYGLLLWVEAVCLLVPVHSWIFLSRTEDVQVFALCVAMGMQNSFVTRLSGAVVRTTHLTGVLTDLGIEMARWFRHLKSHVMCRWRLRGSGAAAPIERPHGPKVALLVTVFFAFVLGSAQGALLAAHFGSAALYVPAVLLALGGLWAFVTSREIVGMESRK